MNQESTNDDVDVSQFISIENGGQWADVPSHAILPAYLLDADKLHPSRPQKRHPLSASRRRELLNLTELGQMILKRMNRYEFAEWMP